MRQIVAAVCRPECSANRLTSALPEGGEAVRQAVPLSGHNRIALGSDTEQSRGVPTPSESPRAERGRARR